MGIGRGAALNGFVPFPVNDPFNQPVTGLPVDPGSAAIIGGLGQSGLHADFGAGTYDGSAMGIPYEVVGSQTLVPITYTAYGAQSDDGPMPIPANAPVEGAVGATTGDRHVLILSQSNCFLYELYNAVLQTDGSWKAASGAIWDLLGDNQRPYTWTSADAAGLPVFPGLVRYDEIAAGAINHALRFTVSHSREDFIAPATHMASSSTSLAYAAMGTRLRLKASYDIATATPQAKIILQALKTYGMIVADNGSNMYLSGSPDSRWNNDDLHTLGDVPASAFEVVTTGPAWTDAIAPKGPLPVLAGLSATVTNTSIAYSPLLHKTVTTTVIAPLTETAAVAAGTAVTLNWAGSGASYFILTPGPGAVRGTSAVVKPNQTTTYTLHATSHFGSVTQTFTVTVQ